MNHTAYSILFCALLASTFAHEFTSKAAANPSFAAKVLERDANPSDSSENCKLICNYDNSSVTTISGNGSITITVNVTAGLFVAVNVNASAAVIFDVNSSTVVVLNGTNGAAVVLYLEPSTGVYISTGAWLSSKTSIQEFLASFSVTALVKIPGAVPFQVSTASTVIMKVISGVIIHLLSTSIAVAIEANAKLGLELVIAMGKQIIFLLNGSLKGFLELIGTKEIILKYGLTECLNLMDGLGMIFGKITGGLIVAKVSIDLAAIATATNGAEVLFMVMLALHAAKINIGTLLGIILNNPEELFALIVRLGGGAIFGLNGLFKVVEKIVAFINGKAELEVMITVLIQFMAYNNEQLSEAFKSTLRLFLEIVIKVGGESLEALQTMLKALIAGNFIHKGVNISVIIEILLSGIVQGKAHLLRVLVAVMLKMTAIVSASIALPMVLFVMFIHLNTKMGIELMKKFLAIEINIGVAAGSVILAALKSLRNIPSLLLGDFYSLLTSLPGIGILVKAFSEAISAASHGQYNLKRLVNGSFKSSCKALFQLLGIPLGVSLTIMKNVKQIMTNCTSLSIYGALSFTINYS